jgi:hypothetical protein
MQPPALIARPNGGTRTTAAQKVSTAQATRDDGDTERAVHTPLGDVTGHQKKRR